MGLGLRENGDNSGYLGQLQATLAADPFYIPANLDIAAILMAQGRNNEARRYIDKVLRVDPRNERAKAFLKQLGL